MKKHRFLLLGYFLYAGCFCWAEPPAPHVIYTVEQLQERAPASHHFWLVSQAEADKAWAAVVEKLHQSKIPKDSPLRVKLDSYAVGFAGRIDPKTGKKLIAITGDTEYSPDRMPGLARTTLTKPKDPRLFAIYSVEEGKVIEFYPGG